MKIDLQLIGAGVRFGLATLTLWLGLGVVAAGPAHAINCADPANSNSMLCGLANRDCFTDARAGCGHTGNDPVTETSLAGEIARAMDEAKAKEMQVVAEKIQPPQESLAQQACVDEIMNAIGDIETQVLSQTAGIGDALISQGLQTTLSGNTCTRMKDAYDRAMQDVIDCDDMGGAQLCSTLEDTSVALGSINQTLTGLNAACLSLANMKLDVSGMLTRIIRTVSSMLGGPIGSAVASVAGTITNIVGTVTSIIDNVNDLRGCFATAMGGVNDGPGVGYSSNPPDVGDIFDPNEDEDLAAQQLDSLIQMLKHEMTKRQDQETHQEYIIRLGNGPSDALRMMIYGLCGPDSPLVAQCNQRRAALQQWAADKAIEAMFELNNFDTWVDQNNIAAWMVPFSIWDRNLIDGSDLCHDDFPTCESRFDSYYYKIHINTPLNYYRGINPPPLSEWFPTGNDVPPDWAAPEEAPQAAASARITPAAGNLAPRRPQQRWSPPTSQQPAATQSAPVRRESGPADNGPPTSGARPSARPIYNAPANGRDGGSENGKSGGALDVLRGLFQ